MIYYNAISVENRLTLDNFQLRSLDNKCIINVKLIWFQVLVGYLNLTPDFHLAYVKMKKLEIAYQFDIAQAQWKWINIL